MTDEILEYFKHDLKKIEAAFKDATHDDLVETLYGKGLESLHISLPKKYLKGAFTENSQINRKPLSGIVELAQTKNEDLRKYPGITGDITLELINRGLLEIAKLG